MDEERNGKWTCAAGGMASYTGSLSYEQTILAQGESQALAPVPGKRYWADPAPRPRFFAPLFFGYFKKTAKS